MNTSANLLIWICRKIGGNNMELPDNISIVSLKDLPDYRQTLIDYVENNWKDTIK
jgi:hypothetical protein